MSLVPQGTPSPCTFGRTGEQGPGLPPAHLCPGHPAPWQGGPSELQWFSSRDLVGSGYTETYTAANGSQVTEQLQGQVRPGGPPQGGWGL